MFYIGKVNNLRMAQAFIDYANGFGANCRLKESDEGCEIWLINGEHRVKTITELEEFNTHPNQGKYLAASWETPNQQIESNNDLSRNPNRELLNSIVSKSSLFVVVVFSLCWLVFMGGSTVFDYLYIAPQGQAITLSQPWRLVTPALIHFSMLHLTFNLIWWWQLGGLVEIKQSIWKIANLFFIAAIISNVAQYAVGGPNFGGLSGVVYALFGYCWILGKYKPSLGISLPPAIFGFSLIWMAAGFFELIPINMANTAHLMGLCVGCALGWFESKK